MQKLKELFTLEIHRASDEEIHNNILSGVEIRGGNLAILFCAIFIASLGLNVNSTAVIIGAMLISPLMGPIIAIGYGIGTNDFEIIKKAIKILTIEIIISMITSILYFSITPLKEAGSEIMARTSPTIWDVMIAFIGGLAGIIGVTRREKTNVIPGVAIATALMPPLCTAGFGLATMQGDIFLGAFYLFLINSVFISLSTYVVTKLLKLPIKSYLDEKVQKKMRATIFSIMVVTVIPSIFIAYNIVVENITSTNINKFVKSELNFAQTRVIAQYFDNKEKKLEVVLVGEQISKDVEKFLEQKMKEYSLENISLIFNQGGNNISSLEEVEKLKESFLNQMKKNEEVILEVQKNGNNTKNIDNKKIIEEVKILFPNIEDLGINSIFMSDKNKEALVVIIKSSDEFDKENLNKLEAWLKVKFAFEDVYIFDKTKILNRKD